MNAGVETTIAEVAQKTAYAGAGTGVLGFITSDVGVAVAGLLIALIASLVSIWCRLDDRKRAKELHAARMDFLRSARSDACDVNQAARLGIDTSDFGALGSDR